MRSALSLLFCAIFGHLSTMLRRLKRFEVGADPFGGLRASQKGRLRSPGRDPVLVDFRANLW